MPDDDKRVAPPPQQQHSWGLGLEGHVEVGQRAVRDIRCSRLHAGLVKVLCQVLVLVFSGHSI